MNFDTAKYKLWTWKNPLMLHWMLNPGLAFNELVLGQRIPKIMLIERDSHKSLAEKSFIPCPHCNTIHPSVKWSVQNHTAFKNWFGLYCDNCGNTIPCLTNLTSYLLLALTFPVWVWFRKSWKRKWLSVQKEKFLKPANLTVPQFNWVAVGLSWGFFMFLFMEVIYVLISGGRFSLRGFFVGMVTWTLGGLFFGFIMKKFMGRLMSKASRGKTNGQPEQVG